MHCLTIRLRTICMQVQAAMNMLIAADDSIPEFCHSAVGNVDQQLVHAFCAAD